jgi:hypothetical protein
MVVPWARKPRLQQTCDRQGQKLKEGPTEFMEAGQGLWEGVGLLTWACVLRHDKLIEPFGQRVLPSDAARAAAREPFPKP